jgi:hypothetical protein
MAALAEHHWEAVFLVISLVADCAIIWTVHYWMIIYDYYCTSFKKWDSLRESISNSDRYCDDRDMSKVFLP